MLKETEETVGFLSHFYHWWHIDWGGGGIPESPRATPIGLKMLLRNVNKDISFHDELRLSEFRIVSVQVCELVTTTILGVKNLKVFFFIQSYNGLSCAVLSPCVVVLNLAASQDCYKVTSQNH